MPKTLQNKVRDSLKAHGVKRVDLLVAVSGGGDSVALLYLLNSLTDEFALKLHIAHVNHGLRKESDTDERLVHDLAKKLELPFISCRITPPQASFEARSREMRYSFFKEELAKLPSKKRLIVTAHTLDDQAETVLLNLLRGAGVRGLAGMAELEGPLFRPLIHSTRAELRAYIRSKRVGWREDATNLDTRFARNKIRHKLIPYLKKYNPNIVSTLARTGAAMREVEEITWNEAEAAYRKVRLRKGVLKRKSFLLLTSAIQGMVLLKGIEEVKGDTRDIEQIHIAKALDVVSSARSPRTVEFPSSLKLLKSSDKLTLSVFKRKSGNQGS